jgi:hypothetical protein
VDLTQAKWALRLDKPQSVVSAYEAGKRRLDLVKFGLIAKTSRLMFSTPFAESRCGAATHIFRSIPPKSKSCSSGHRSVPESDFKRF